jgi:hypothetical protein
MAKKQLNQKDLEEYQKRLTALLGALTGDIDKLEQEALGDRTASLEPNADGGTDSYFQEFSLELLERDESTCARSSGARSHQGRTFGNCETAGRDLEGTIEARAARAQLHRVQRRKKASSGPGSGRVRWTRDLTSSELLEPEPPLGVDAPSRREPPPPARGRSPAAVVAVASSSRPGERGSSPGSSAPELAPVRDATDTRLASSTAG